MTGYFEKQLTESINRIDIFGYTITGWYGIAMALKEKGYVVVTYEDGTCGQSYYISKENISLPGYTINYLGKTLFFQSSRYKPEYFHRLVDRIIYQLGLPVYNHKLYCYFMDNLKEATCNVTSDTIKINGNVVDSPMIYRIY